MTHNDTIIVQRLRAEVARKTQKYSRIAAQEFPPFQAYEMFIDSIKSACRKRYVEAIRNQPPAQGFPASRNSIWLET